MVDEYLDKFPLVCLGAREDLVAQRLQFLHSGQGGLGPLEDLPKATTGLIRQMSTHILKLRSLGRLGKHKALVRHFCSFLTHFKWDISSWVFFVSSLQTHKTQAEFSDIDLGFSFHGHLGRC